MQQTIEFENELHRRYPQVNEKGEEEKTISVEDANKQIKVSAGRVVV